VIYLQRSFQCEKSCDLFKSCSEARGSAGGGCEEREATGVRVSPRRCRDVTKVIRYNFLFSRVSLYFTVVKHKPGFVFVAHPYNVNVHICRPHAWFKSMPLVSLWLTVDERPEKNVVRPDANRWWIEPPGPETTPSWSTCVVHTQLSYFVLWREASWSWIFVDEILSAKGRPRLRPMSAGISSSAKKGRAVWIMEWTLARRLHRWEASSLREAHVNILDIYQQRLIGSRCTSWKVIGQICRICKCLHPRYD